MCQNLTHVSEARLKEAQKAVEKQDLLERLIKTWGAQRSVRHVSGLAAENGVRFQFTYDFW